MTPAQQKIINLLEEGHRVIKIAAMPWDVFHKENKIAFVRNVQPSTINKLIELGLCEIRSEPSKHFITQHLELTA